MPHGIIVVTLRGSRIADITTFLIPEDFVRLGLPDELSVRGAGDRALP